MLDDSYDSDFPFPHQDDPRINNLQQVGVDKAVVDRLIGDPHWSELPKPVRIFEPREFGDNDKSDPFNVDKE